MSRRSFTEDTDDELPAGTVAREAMPVVDGAERWLEIHGAIGDVVSHDLVGEPLPVVALSKHFDGPHVHVRERRKRAVAADLGHHHVVLRRQIGQRRRPHARLEMDVEMGFGQSDEVTHGRAPM